jgi:hypothetical protein
MRWRLGARCIPWGLDLHRRPGDAPRGVSTVARTFNDQQNAIAWHPKDLPQLILICRNLSRLHRDFPGSAHNISLSPAVLPYLPQLLETSPRYRAIYHKLGLSAATSRCLPQLLLSLPQSGVTLR